MSLALALWVKLRNAEPDDFMFVDDAGGVMIGDHRLAEVLRASLWEAKVRRSELHVDRANSRKLRVHHLRGTFVTLNLANGKTESWTSDRTGHGSSEMVNRYRRAARSARELGLGALDPLDMAIPELAALPRDYPASSAPSPN